jgi:hypothetical protein
MKLPILILLVAVSSCRDHRAEFRPNEYQDGLYPVTKTKDGYIKIILEKNPCVIAFAELDGDKLRILGSSKVGADGKYQCIYDVRLGDGKTLAGSGYAMVMSEGNVTNEGKSFVVDGMLAIEYGCKFHKHNAD